jgi:hypothetical protein
MTPCIRKGQTELAKNEPGLQSALGPPPRLQYEIRVHSDPEGDYKSRVPEPIYYPTLNSVSAENVPLSIPADRMSDDRLDPLTVDPVMGAESVACDLVGGRRERPGTEGSSATCATYCPADVAVSASSIQIGRF